MRSLSNREDGSSHISHPGKDAAIYKSTLQFNAKIFTHIAECVINYAMFLFFSEQNLGWFCR